MRRRQVAERQGFERLGVVDNAQVADFSIRWLRAIRKMGGSLVQNWDKTPGAADQCSIPYSTAGKMHRELKKLQECKKGAVVLSTDGALFQVPGRSNQP